MHKCQTLPKMHKKLKINKITIWNKFTNNWKQCC